jgi:2-deoxy-D-gluconate 3-dehydrogenase
MNDLFDLTGRRAIVTGGGGTLGSAMAGALYRAGADVALIGRSDSIYRAAEAIVTPGRPISAVLADLRTREAIEDGFGAAVDKLGGVDILICSHGIVRSAPSLDYSLDDWSDIVDSNLNSVFQLAQLAGKQMIANGSGKIITIASMLAFSGGLRAAAYAASKGGVAQMTKALANEWAPLGVNVNAIAPGYMKTNLNRHIWTDPVRAEQILARLPAGRWGNADDLDGATVFLASHASDYIHGIVLPVDGGWLAR